MEELKMGLFWCDVLAENVFHKLDILKMYPGVKMVLEYIECKM